MAMQAVQLKKTGRNVIAIFPSQGLTEDFERMEESGITVYPYPIKQKNILKTIFFIRRIIKKHNADIIHSHHYFADFLVFLARLGLKKKSHIITVHSYVSKIDAAFFRKIQIGLCVYFAYNFAYKVLPVNEDLRRNLNEKYRVPFKKMTTVINGIDFKKYVIIPAAQKRITEEYSINPNSIIILSAGLICKGKGHSFLINALKDLHFGHSIKCFIIGKDGGELSKLRQIAKILNLNDTVFFPGYTADIASWLSLGKYYVHPSLNEATPLAILEAMYFRIPVIASDIPPLRAIISHMKTGLLVEPENPQAIREALITLQNNSKLAGEITENAFKFVSENASIEKMTEKILLSFPPIDS